MKKSTIKENSDPSIITTIFSGNLWKKIILLVVGFNLFLSSFYFLRGDLNFHTDIARDFLLLDDLAQKKVVLIGARAGPAGFFHGPAWMYLNLPAYLLGNGNPVVVEGFWIILTALFLWYSFSIAKKLFEERTAFLYLLFMSCYLIFFVREYSHQYAGMMLMPLFFYTFLQYVKTVKAKYLATNVLISGFLIQFEIAYGGPLTFLAFLFMFYTLLKHKKFLHIIIYTLILIPLSTYILFDLRHNFMMLHSLQEYMKGNKLEHYVGIMDIIKNRIEYMTSSALPLLWGLPSPTNILGALFLGILLNVARETKENKVYRYFFYFFFGYFIFSLTNRYYLLGQHFLGFVPIVFMMVASLITTRFQKYILLLFLFIILNNQVEALKFIVSTIPTTGTAETSWKFYDTLGQKVFAMGSEKEFGYFVWTPDKFAYAPRYGMVYAGRINPAKKSYLFMKKPVTYLIFSPALVGDTAVDGQFWKTHSITITKQPQSVFTFPNGYRIERYELTPTEAATPFDPTQDMGIHFR
jgi:hypothetical protein